MVKNNLNISNNNMFTNIYKNRKNHQDRIQFFNYQQIKNKINKLYHNNINV